MHGSDAGRQPDPAGVDPKYLREVFGTFATGIVAVTAIDPDNAAPVGFAANSFASVSLSPPLVSFCAAHTSSSWPRVRIADSYCVNVLAAEQEWVCRQFARPGGDKFAGVAWQPSPRGAPILDEAVAWIEASTVATHAAGDHDLVIAQVHELALTSRDPLVFYRGTYCRLSS